MLALLFPVYYNLLSSMVTRRDELVLKRLRTGETRDSELLLVDGAAGRRGHPRSVRCAVAARRGPRAAVAVEPAALRGHRARCLRGVRALAIWTAAWTRNAEAAQMTSMPIILLAVVGSQPASPTAGAASSTSRREQRWTGSCASPGSDVDGDADASTSSATWAAAGPPLLVLAFWTGARHVAGAPVDALGTARVTSRVCGVTGTRVRGRGGPMKLWRGWAGRSQVERVDLYTRQSLYVLVLGVLRPRAGRGHAEAADASPCCSPLSWCGDRRARRCRHPAPAATWPASTRRTAPLPMRSSPSSAACALVAEGLVLLLPDELGEVGGLVVWATLAWSIGGLRDRRISGRADGRPGVSCRSADRQSRVLRPVRRWSPVPS